MKHEQLRAQHVGYLKDLSSSPGQVKDSYSIIELLDENLKLRLALKDLFLMMDEGLLVRNTDDDHKPDFAMRALTLVERLKSAHAAMSQPDNGNEKC